MQYETQMTILHEDMLEDDIDILFHQLQPIEPPPSFVLHILSQVATHPTHPTSQSFFALPLMSHELDTWVGQQKKRSLC
jgi:hypothetical protein